MAKLTRRELKTDELTTRFAAIAEFFLKNRKEIQLAGAVVLLLLVAAWGISLYLRGRQAQANEAFGMALTTYHSLVSASPPQEANLQYFKTAEEKYQEARKQFQTVAEQFSGFSQGRWARLYAALCQRELGNLSEAETELSSLAGRSDTELATQAKMALAGIYQQSNRLPEAERLYRELLDGRPSVTVPKATIQIVLASLYQQTDPEQALRIYHQMAEEYSGTTIGEVVADMLANAPQ